MHIDWTPVINALPPLAAAFIAAIAAAVRGPIVTAIRTNTAETQRRFIAEVAHEAVHYAEVSGLTAPEKKRQAVGYVCRALAAHGASISEEDASDAIEAALAYAKGVFREVAAE